MNALSAVAKAGMVVGGYVMAILFAIFVVWVSIIFSSVPEAEREASAGMYGFGEALLFIAVFGAPSIVPTGFALVFLRRTPSFWVVLAVVALAVASTGLAEVALTILDPQGLNPWTMMAFPRIFQSPFLATAFGLAALLAPAKRVRWILFGAAASEAVSSSYGFLHWFAPLFFG